MSSADAPEAAAVVLFSKRQVVISFACTCGLAAACLGIVLLLLGDDEPRGRGRPADDGMSIPVMTEQVVLDDVFQGDLAARWEPWRAVSGRPGEARQTPQGLLLSLETERSPSSAVFTLGVRSQARFEVRPGLRVRASLDWRPPANASYRAAGILLAATPGPIEPDTLRPAVWLEVSGVPPGDRARFYGAVRLGLHERPIATDGWPELQRGRVVERVTLEMAVEGASLVLRADGEELARCPTPPLGDAVWVALYTRSHANYPARPVVFERLTVDYGAGG